MIARLFLALLFCPLSAHSDEAAVSVSEGDGATVGTQTAHPDLLRLERELARKLDEKKDGRITPERYRAWNDEFRVRLDDAASRVPPSPDNAAARARIMARLGENEEAHSVLDQALDLNPNSSILLATKGRVLFDQNDFPGAAQMSLEAWESSGRTDQGAWALYQMSKGRRAASAPSAVKAESPAKPVITAVAGVDDTEKPIKLPVRARSSSRAVPIPGEDADEPIKRESGLPLWPVAVPLSGGLIAYGLYRSTRQAGKKETDEAPSEALIAIPLAARGTAEVAGRAAVGAAKGASATSIGGLAVTGVAAAGILVAGGATLALTVNYGLDRMIEAQERYNESIDTRKDDQRRAPRTDPVLGEKPGRKCLPATPENIRIVTRDSEMLSLQPRVSAPGVQSFVDMIESGAMPLPIKVDGDTIVDGNHRFIAGLLCRVEIARTPYVAPSGVRRFPIRSIEVSLLRW